jgi:hypothetical protein
MMDNELKPVGISVNNLYLSMTRTCLVIYYSISKGFEIYQPYGTEKLPN